MWSFKDCIENCNSFPENKSCVVTQTSLEDTAVLPLSVRNRRFEILLTLSTDAFLYFSRLSINICPNIHIILLNISITVIKDEPCFPSSVAAEAFCTAPVHHVTTQRVTSALLHSDCYKQSHCSLQGTGWSMVKCCFTYCQSLQSQWTISPFTGIITLLFCYHSSHITLTMSLYHVCRFCCWSWEGCLVWVGCIAFIFKQPGST